MINAIDLSRLRNAEFLQFMKDFAGLVNDNDPAALNVATQHTALVTKNTELENLFKKELASELTQEILDLDNRRDRAYNGILFVVQGYLNHFEPAKVQAATKLKANIDLYGSGAAKQNYQAETAILNNILIDWENKPDLVDAVNTLDLKNWKDELKDANTLFDQKYIARTIEYSQANPETLLAKRAEGTQVYYTLRQFIDAFAVTINTPIYQTVTNQLNALIAQYNTLLNNRLARMANDAPPTPETPTP